jgi:glycerol-3-phosphate acyltransferase PlsX
MGGDYAPHEVVLGAVAARDLLPQDEIILVGDQTAILAELKGAGADPGRFTLVHASETVAMAESPVDAIRKKPDSSMRRAVELMAAGKADGVISAGNTGAFVAASHMLNKRLTGIRRPGISVVFPTYHGPVVLIDVGANVDSRPIHLVQYALMADIYARHVIGINAPRVGILSIGEESEKGNELVKSAGDMLRRTNLNFLGNAEGRDLFNGRFDVVVCDGFVGNVVLKTVEGLVSNTLDAAAIAKVGPVMKELQKRHDSEEYGGAPLLGVSGVVTICHGNSRSRAIANAFRAAATCVRMQVNERIVEAVAQIGEPAE